MMVFVNEVYKNGSCPKAYAEGFIKMLSCITPHVGEEIWQLLGHDDTIAYESWPTYSEEKCKDAEVNIAVQVNGKMRGTVLMDADLSNEEVVANAVADEKIAKFLQKRFGLVPGITDRNYITNSYHVHVTEQIDTFTKLKFESDFQRLSPGGAISYVEVPNMQDNLEAVISVLQFIYDNIMYAELNTKSDYCQCCGYDGEIKIVEDDGKLVWECPKCGNRDQNKLNVARRTCGYIGTQFWNQGRTQEIKDRVLHL